MCVMNKIYYMPFLLSSWSRKGGGGVGVDDPPILMRNIIFLHTVIPNG